MVEKLINSINQISLPITEKEKEPDQFYNQVFSLMIDKYPKIYTEFRITRNNKGLLIEPKNKKKCDAIINKFIKEAYHLDNIQELTDTQDIETITLSKYKTSSSPHSTEENSKPVKNKGKERILEEVPPILEQPSSSQQRTFKPIEFKWEEIDEPSSSSRTPSVSTTTRENTRRNGAPSVSNFSNYDDYRQYKITQSKLNNLKDVVTSWASMFVIPPDQPCPWQSDIDQIPKKSPLDFYKLDIPKLSGIKEEAQKYLDDFIRFNNNYISIPSEKDLIEFFVSSQSNDFIKKRLRSFIQDESPDSFATVAQFFIANFGTRTIVEQIHFWNNFRLNYKNPNKSKLALDNTASVLKFSEYDKAAKILSILPESWRYELIDNDIIPSYTNPMYNDVWDFINNKLAKQALIKEYNFIISSRFGGGSKTNKKNNKEKTSEDNKENHNSKSNKLGYKAFKKENKYKRKESYKTTIYPATKLSEEDIKKEIVENIENHFSLHTTEIEEIEISSLVSFYTDEVEEIKEKTETIQKEVKNIQQNCQVTEIKYTKAVIPVLSESKKK